MLSKPQEIENKDNNNEIPTLYPSYLLFRLAHTDEFPHHIVAYLDKQDLENFISAMSVCTHKFFKPYKEVYLRLTRENRALQLRDYILHWNYPEIEKLVSMDPLVLSIVCDYKMNRSQEDSTSRPLSALEYAYLAGDENFIELFERLGEGHLDESCYKNKDDLQAESNRILSEISMALTAYAKVGPYRAINPIWYAAPHWLYGLAYHLGNYDKEIRSCDVSLVSAVDFRDWAITCGPPCGHIIPSPKSAELISLYIRHHHTLANRNATESNLTESTCSCQIQ